MSNEFEFFTAQIFFIRVTDFLYNFLFWGPNLKYVCSGGGGVNTEFNYDIWSDLCFSCHEREAEAFPNTSTFSGSWSIKCGLFVHNHAQRFCS